MSRQLEEFKKATRPLAPDGSFYTWKDVFTRSLGWHLINYSTASEFNRFGYGIALYFKFLKYQICMFFTLFLITIPLLLFYLEVGEASLLVQTDLTLFDRIFLTTIGVIGQGIVKPVSKVILSIIF